MATNRQQYFAQFEDAGTASIEAMIDEALTKVDWQAESGDEPRYRPSNFEGRWLHSHRPGRHWRGSSSAEEDSADEVS